MEMKSLISKISSFDFTLLFFNKRISPHHLKESNYQTTTYKNKYLALITVIIVSMLEFYANFTAECYYFSNQNPYKLVTVSMSWCSDINLFLKRI